jgi:hypothetical protein
MDWIRFAFNWSKCFVAGRASNPPGSVIFGGFDWLTTIRAFYADFSLGVKQAAILAINRITNNFNVASLAFWTVHFYGAYFPAWLTTAVWLD